MKVVVFGANGRTGSHLVKLLAEKGHDVVAVARNISTLTVDLPNVEKVQAEVSKMEDVEKIFKKSGIEAVFNTLGPKSMFKKDPEVLRALDNIVRAAEKYKVKRFYHISFAAAREDGKNLNLLYKSVIPNVMTNLVGEHKKREQVVRRSKLHWVIVQPPVLNNGAMTANYKTDSRIKDGKEFKKKCSRANVAHYMVSLLEQPKVKNKEIFISE